MQRKYQMLRDITVKYDCDSILFLDQRNIRYLCGFKGDNGLLIYRNGEMTLVTDPRFELEASGTVKSAKVIINKNESALWNMPELYKELGIKRLGFSPKIMTVDVYEGLKNFVEMVPVDIIPSAYRYIKDIEEISLMRKSAQIMERSFMDVLELLSGSPTERVFAAELDHKMRLNGAEATSFQTIVAFAENSAIVHASPSDKRIQGTGFLLVDMGAVYDGYCSDESVTLIIGEPTKDMLKLYDAVYTAQRKAVDAVKPGVTAIELYDKAYGYLIKEGYGKYIQHSLGHHIGLNIHEYPKIFPFTEFVFEQDMVFTIEPGLYIPGLGGVRLEEMVRVTADSSELLTSISKEKRIII